MSNLDGAKLFIVWTVPAMPIHQMKPCYKMFVLSSTSEPKLTFSRTTMPGSASSACQK